MTDVQKKAQAELDAVIGSDRLPTLADRANLPYINAVVLEVLRWNSVAPTGSSFPSKFQSVTTDFLYTLQASRTEQWKTASSAVTPFQKDPLFLSTSGTLFLIIVPGGKKPTRPFSNRNILHDADIYPEPFEFKPERHISTDDDKPAQRDPRTMCFGFGRRICPGLYLADASLFLTIASSLLLFDITKVVEKNGVEITPVHEQTSGIIS